MELETKLAELAKTVREHREVLATEEAAKNALVMPFLQALGYNVFNPSEVRPEFTCDVGTKKGEKVDYAVCDGEQVRMLIECKPARTELSINHASQLYRYFTTAEARVAVLTNGVVFKFFMDIDSPNKMDKKPFFTLDLDNLRNDDHKTLERFSKASFDVDKIAAEASKLKLQTLVYKELETELSEPSDDFIRIIAGRVEGGRLTAPLRTLYRSLIVSSASMLIRDRVNDRLTNALRGNGEETEGVEIPDANEVETTDVEIEGFNIVRAIAARKVDPSRVVMRDAKSYCAILLDDNNRKSIARLHFNSETARHFGTFEGKEETRHSILNPIEIYQHERSILRRIDELEGE